MVRSFASGHELYHGNQILAGLDPAYNPSPIELIRWGVEQPGYGMFFRKALRKVDNLTMEEVQEIVSKIPASWMSGLAREFVVRLVTYNLGELHLLV